MRTLEILERSRREIESLPVSYHDYGDGKKDPVTVLRPVNQLSFLAADSRLTKALGPCECAAPPAKPS